MHRGSSKADGDSNPPAENLPLSAPSLGVDVEVVRAARSQRHHLALTAGATVRECVRAVGLSPEGTAVLLDGRSVPLDRPVADGEHLVVVPTFSGG